MHYSLIQELHNKLTKKEISCVELTKLYLNKITKENPYYHTYITVTDDTALEQAKVVDKLISGGADIPKLCGIPMTLKDNIYTKGIRTTCSSKMLYNFVPTYNATAYSHLKEQNVVLLGKTNADEFSMGGLGKTSYYGTAINPRNHNCFPGGSSSGGAASVAAKQAVFALGSDTGGSVRLPASFCGDVGLKPTYGSISRNGLIVYSIGYDQIGPLTSSVTDNAIVFDAIAKTDLHDPTTHLDHNRKSTFDTLGKSISGMTFAVVEQYIKDLDPSVEKSFNIAVNAYKKMGANIVSISIPQTDYCLSIYKVISNVEAYINMQKYDGKYIELDKNTSQEICSVSELRQRGFGSTVKSRMMFGAYILENVDTEPYYKDASNMQKEVELAFEKALDSVDALITPTSPVTAIRKNDPTLDNYTVETDKFTVPANIAGVPAVTIPCGYDCDGLPIGLQIIGKKFSEGNILNIAYQFERYTQGEYIKDIAKIPD